MPSRPRSRLSRGLPLALVAVALGACGSDDLRSTEDARDAGLEYGKAIVDTVGESATRDEMEALCGKAARDDALTGDEGHQADETVDAFIDGCSRRRRP